MSAKHRCARCASSINRGLTSGHPWGKALGAEKAADWLLVWLLVASADQSAAHLCARRAGASHAAAGRGVPLSVCVYNRVHTRPQNGPTRALRCGRMCGGACGDGCARAEGGEEEQRHRGRHAVALEIRVCSRSRVVGDFLITSRGSEYEYCVFKPPIPRRPPCPPSILGRPIYPPSLATPLRRGPLHPIRASHVGTGIRAVAPTTR